MDDNKHIPHEPVFAWVYLGNGIYQSTDLKTGDITYFGKDGYDDPLTEEQVAEMVKEATAKK